MTVQFIDHIKNTLNGIEADGMLKRERSITSPQGGSIMVDSGGDVPVRMVNLCANNYLGLADDARLIAAAKGAMDSYGFGMASVRFICGAQDIHRTLETKLANYLGKDDAILSRHVLMPMAGYLTPCLALKTRSYPTA
jgi:glycine C-acetyltransferase